MGAIAVALALAMAAAAAQAGTTERVSVATGGGQALGLSFVQAISSDARFVLFLSLAANLVSGDTNRAIDAFLRDRQAGTTERVSLGTGGVQGNGGILAAALSADGRFVAFASSASNLVAGDTNGWTDVFVRDRRSGAVERVSVTDAGAQGDFDSGARVAISADGRIVAFITRADNLVAGEPLCVVVVRDRQTGRNECAIRPLGPTPLSRSVSVALSADGRFVAFDSTAANLVPDDHNRSTDVFVRDRQRGITERVSVDTASAEHRGESRNVSISADGRMVAFASTAQLTAQESTQRNVFVRDRQAGTTVRVSQDSAGNAADRDSGAPAISPDGRFVAFDSQAGNLLPRATDHRWNIFLRDLQTGAIQRMSVGAGGLPTGGPSTKPVVASGGAAVAFTSNGPNLVPGDSNGVGDAFLRTR
ncbi:MAG: hypothetical protein U1E17_23270 [Geminicoccaceae bacterium]